MNPIARIVLLVVVLAAPGITEAKKAHQPSTEHQKNKPGLFDYYVLSLSWSPDYCAGHANQDPQQCGSSKRLGFVLHGLWPQYEQGYPQNCSDVALPESVKHEFAGLYPSDKLFEHEWIKHGTCSGLSPANYLALSKQFKDGVNIPEGYQNPGQPFRTTGNELRTAFAQANPGIPDDAVTMVCSGSGRFLQEVHLCFNKERQARGCAADVVKQMRSTCKQSSFLVQSIR